MFTNYHANSAKSHPANQGFWIETVLVHDVKANECPSATKTSSTVHCNGLIASNVLIGQAYEILDNMILWARSIWEFHLMDFDAVLFKVTCLIKLVIEPDDALYIHV